MLKSLKIFFVASALLNVGSNLSAQYSKELRQIIDTLASNTMAGRKAGDIGAEMASRYIAGYFIRHKIPSVKGTFDTLDYLQPFSVDRFYAVSKVYAILNQDTISIPDAEAFFPPKRKIELLSESSIVIRVQRFRNLLQALDTLASEGSPVIIVLPYRLYSKVAKQFFEVDFLLSPALGFTVVEKKQRALEPLVRLAKTSLNGSGRIVVFISENEICENKINAKAGKTILNPKVKLLITRPIYNESVVTANVVAVLSSNRPENPWLIVGAHYDHLGKSSKGLIYRGADDNASGTAAIMVTAKELAKATEKKSNNLLFVAFSAEEMGLYGSRFFVTSSLMPQNTLAMINLDMVGRPENQKYERNYVYAKYPSSARKVFKKPVKSVTVDSLVVVTKPPLLENLIYRYGSDHASFYSKGVPFLVLFTGLHTDYHKTTDIPDKIAYENLNRIVVWLFTLIRTL